MKSSKVIKLGRYPQTKREYFFENLSQRRVISVIFGTVRLVVGYHDRKSSVIVCNLEKKSCVLILPRNVAKENQVLLIG